MNGGYFMANCVGLDLTKTDPQAIPGIWAKANEALASKKPIIAHNCVWGNAGVVSPITCFGWNISASEIVIVGATLHIHIKSDNTATVLDVVS